MLKQSREFEKNNLSADKVGKTHVMNALNEKWEACKAEEAKLEGSPLSVCLCICLYVCLE